MSLLFQGAPPDTIYTVLLAGLQVLQTIALAYIAIVQITARAKSEDRHVNDSAPDDANLDEATTTTTRTSSPARPGPQTKKKTIVK